MQNIWNGNLLQLLCQTAPFFCICMRLVFFFLLFFHDGLDAALPGGFLLVILVIHIHNKKSLKSTTESCLHVEPTDWLTLNANEERRGTKSRKILESKMVLTMFFSPPECQIPRAGVDELVTLILERSCFSRQDLQKLALDSSISLRGFLLIEQSWIYDCEGALLHPDVDMLALSFHLSIYWESLPVVPASAKNNLTYPWGKTKV